MSMSTLIAEISSVVTGASIIIAAVARALKRHRAWLTTEVTPRLDQMHNDVLDASERLNELFRLTRYHTGPNGDSPPLHSRIQRIETEVGLRPPLPAEWHWPHHNAPPEDAQ